MKVSVVVEKYRKATSPKEEQKKTEESPVKTQEKR